MEDSFIKVCFPCNLKYLICKQLTQIYVQAYMHIVFVNDTPLKDIISIIIIIWFEHCYMYNIIHVTVFKTKVDGPMKMVVSYHSS